MLLLGSWREYFTSLVELRSIADIVLVFLVVYGVLKLLRGTRAAPMAAAMGAFALLYWLAVNGGLVTLEFVLRGALLYIGVAIIVLFQAEIRQALITFGNRFRVPFTRRQRGRLGESIYDNIVLAATTLASTKTGALIVIERNVGLRGIVEAGVQLDAELSYDLIDARFNPATDLFIFANVSMDTLDYTSGKVNEGSKAVMLGLGEAKRDLPHEFHGQLPRDVAAAEELRVITRL